MEYTLLRTARGEYNMTEGVWATISEEAKDLISQLLNLNPEDRIGL
jgi:serine/threonine protein kinase